MRPRRTVIVVPSPAGLAVARRIARAIPRAELHGRAGRIADADGFFADTVPHLQSLFEEGATIIGVCASGILIRALAPLLASKRDEAPVLAVSGDGGAVVPLLGGHRGGNRLARRLADALDGHAAITTAGDLAFGIALDDPPPGWHLVNPEAAGPFAAALLAGEKARLIVEAGAAKWLEPLALSEAGARAIRVTDRAQAGEAGELVYNPPVLALGVGCERDIAPEELVELVRGAVADAGLAAWSIACVASIDLKMDEPAVLALAEQLGIPARFCTARRLEMERPRLRNPSEEVFRATGCHGVAEGAALAAAGPGSELVVAKTKSARATCAIARAIVSVDPLMIGQGRGKLSIVGLGPGSLVWRSPEARMAIAAATDLVGYDAYLDLIGPTEGKIRHQSKLGQEIERVRHALELAADGRNVVLVGSGDAGIYGLASLVLETLDRADEPAWRRIELAFVPGITALQAAAARAGAPIGHDFCAISLSDLLTPWETIERRLRAAAEGDFVIALYNPASDKRRVQLDTALAILRAARPPETPVVTARNLGRIGESVSFAALADFDPATVDMLTVLLVGSTTTRFTGFGRKRWVYTPRGYADKAAQ